MRNFRQVLLVLAVLLVLLVPTGCLKSEVTKTITSTSVLTTYTSDTQVLNKIQSLEGVVQSLSSTVASLSTQIPSYLEAELDEVESTLYNLDSSITELKNLAYDQSVNLGDLESRLAQLEVIVISMSEAIAGLSSSTGTATVTVTTTVLTSTTTTTVKPIDALVLEVTTYGNPTLNSGSTSFSYFFKVKVENKLDIPIADATVEVFFVSNNIYGAVLDTATLLISSGDVSWYPMPGNDANCMSFLSGWSALPPIKVLDLEPGEVKTMYLTLIANFSTTPTNTVVWMVDTLAVDYEVN